MQTSLPAGLPQRLAYYVSCLYVAQLREGEDYPRLRPAISICVLGKSLFTLVPDLHLDFRLQNAKHGLLLTDDLQVHLLELPKYNCGGGDFAGGTPLEKWAYFFRFVEQLSPEEIARHLVDVEFMEATGVLEMIAKTPRERDLYEARLKMERDAAARLQFAKEEGLAEGRAEGRAEALERGEYVGRIRVLQQILGLPESSASELVNLEIEHLSKLANDLQNRLRERS